MITWVSSGLKKIHILIHSKYKYLHVKIASLAKLKSCITVGPISLMAIVWPCIISVECNLYYMYIVFSAFFSPPISQVVKFGKPTWTRLVMAVMDKAGGNNPVLAKKIAREYQVAPGNHISISLIPGHEVIVAEHLSARHLILQYSLATRMSVTHWNAIITVGISIT